jgi:hypothetical protein
MRLFTFICFVLLFILLWGCRPHPRRWQGHWQLQRIENKHLQRVSDALFVLRLFGVEEAAWEGLARQSAGQFTLVLHDDGYFEWLFLNKLRLVHGRWRRRLLPPRLELVFAVPILKKEKRLRVAVDWSVQQMRWHNFDRSGSVIILKRKN